MSSADETGVNVKAIAGVLAGLTVAGGLAFLTLPDDPAPTETAAVEEAGAPPAALTDLPAPAEDAVADAEAPPEAMPEPPRFDQIRVAPDGSAVIAGQAPAGSDVSLRLDGAEISATRTSGGGDFAAILSLSPAAAPRIMSLVATLEDGTELPGAETVIIAPFGAVTEPPAAEVAEADAGTVTEDTASVPQVAADDTTLEIASAEVVAAPEGPTGDTPTSPPPAAPVVGAEGSAPSEPPPAEEPAVAGADDVAPAPAPAPAPVTDTASGAAVAAGAADTGETATAATEVAETSPSAEVPAAQADSAAAPSDVAAPAPDPAPAIVVAGPEGVRVLQGGTPPEAQTSVELDAITYSAEGAVSLSGRGMPDRQVQILLNNTPIQLGEIGPGGAWSLELPDVDPGTYTLSVAQLSETGEVESRIDTPFLREDPARIAASPMRVGAGVSVITVQPGFTLWGIAEANFGDGIAYVQIFEENRDEIRDPDWIFPGQIFRLPDMPRAAE